MLISSLPVLLRRFAQPPQTICFRSSETGRLMDLRLQVQVEAVANVIRRIVNLAERPPKLLPTAEELCETHLKSFDSTRSENELSWTKALELTPKYTSTSIHELTEEILFALESFPCELVEPSVLKDFVTSRLRMEVGSRKESIVLDRLQRKFGPTHKTDERFELVIASFDRFNVSLSGRFDGIVKSSDGQVPPLEQIEQLVEIKYRCGAVQKNFQSPNLPFDRKWYEAQIQSYFLLAPKCRVVHLVCAPRNESYLNFFVQASFSLVHGPPKKVGTFESRPGAFQFDHLTCLRSDDYSSMLRKRLVEIGRVIAQLTADQEVLTSFLNASLSTQCTQYRQLRDR